MSTNDTHETDQKPASNAEPPVRDLTKEIADASKNAPAIPGEVEAFLRSKARLIKGHQGLDENARGNALAHLELAANEFSEAPVAIEPPPPGGVGYGFFYRPPFKNAFATGTAIEFIVICPTTPGGNVADWLYLTAMNRACQGVEALILYHAQDPLRLCVYDWSRPGSYWQTNLDDAMLTPYFLSITVNGNALQAIHVMNATFQISPSIWTNQVFLKNVASSTYDRIYRYDYLSSLAIQQVSGIGSWGPIVETFQTGYIGTNILGFQSTKLATRPEGDNSAIWSPLSWAALTPIQSDIRNDANGFSIVDLVPNTTLVVHAV